MLRLAEIAHVRRLSLHEGLREKVHDALLRARRPPMTFTGLLIFRSPARGTIRPCLFL